MSTGMTSGDFFSCPNCGGKQGYHNLPCSGGQPWTVPIHMPVIAPTLTEADVRRIVREELAALKEQAK